MSRVARAAFFAALALCSLEWMLTSPVAFGLTTATALQRAVCRVLDGQPLAELAEHPDVIEAIGTLPANMGTPEEMVLIAGVRAAKSMIAAAGAVRCSQRVQIPSWVHSGEVPRVSIISLDKDKANVVFHDHLVSKLQQSPVLRKLLIGEPKAGSLFLRHPSGRPIEISVRAGKRAGGDLVSRWSAGCIFDEAPRMLGASEGVVNLDDARKAVLSRLLPGAMLIDMGSPWAPFGPVYEMFTKHRGKPTRAVVVVVGRGPQMNPSWWTPVKCAELKKRDPDAHATDVEARFLSQEESLLSATVLERCTRKGGDLPYDAFASYWAAMDPATRGNSWTLTIGTRAGKVRRIACVQQWTGSSAEPLSPKDTMAAIARVLRSYGLKSVESDQYYIDSLVAFGKDVHLDGKPYPITVVQHELSEQQKTEAYLAIRTKLGEGELELHPDPVFLEDLRRVRRRVTQRGVSIVLPKTQDGRHCDFAPSFMLVCARNLADIKDPPRRAVDPLTDEQRKRDFARLRGTQQQSRRVA